MAKDSADRIELGRSFHQEETFNLKVCESDFFAYLWWHNKATFIGRMQASRGHISLKYWI